MATPIDRRHFLAASAGLLLAACGKDGTDGKKADVAVTRRDRESKELSVVLGVDPNNAVIAGIDQRVPFVVLEGETPTVAHEAEVGFASGAKGPYGSSIKAEAHKDGMESRPYYVVRHTFPTPGVYRLGVNINGGGAEAVLNAVDASSVQSPVPGRAMPAVKTPTVADQMGINPICTRSPACPWHDVSFDAALAEKRPVAFYVGTPARCATKTCGPVLDVLLDVKGNFESKVRFVHLEVYKTLTSEDTIPAIGELKLQFEPWIFLVGADGVLRDALAGPVDRKEATEALTRLVS